MSDLKGWTLLNSKLLIFLLSLSFIVGVIVGIGLDR
jgi:hypothetical protein